MLLTIAPRLCLNGALLLSDSTAYSHYCLRPRTLSIGPYAKATPSKAGDPLHCDR